MSWYNYDYACGHGSGRVQIYGPTRGRQSKADWYSRSHVCPKCWATKMEEARKKQQTEKTELEKLQEQYDGDYKSQKDNGAKIAHIKIVSLDTAHIVDVTDPLNPTTTTDIPLSPVVRGIDDGTLYKV